MKYRWRLRLNNMLKYLAMTDPYYYVIHRDSLKEDMQAKQ